MSTIPLAKGLNPAKMVFPAMLSEKYDGVPVRIDFDGQAATAKTRQGKPVPSIDNILAEFCRKMRGEFPVTLVGEVIQTNNPRAPFRDTGGIVRRQEPQDGLTILVFDGAIHGQENVPFRQRWENLQRHYWNVPELGFVHQQPVMTLEAFEFHSRGWLDANPDAEGMVLRSMSDVFEPGKRQWGYQKVLREPTIDLHIVGYEEAISKDLQPLGMVGGLYAMYKGQQIGIGPGKLTHAERRELMQTFPTWQGRIAQIKHKGDASYDALRQPTFQHWRDDKSTADV